MTSMMSIPVEPPIENRLTEADFWDRLHVRGVAQDAWYRRLARRHIDQFLRSLLYESSKSPRVIELGCAPGRMLCRLNSVRPDCHFSGIDFSSSGVKTSISATRALGMRANIFQGDVFEIDPSEKNDVAMSFGLVEHFHDPVPILQQHSKFCRPGGTVAITIPNFRPVKKLAYWAKPEQADAHNFEIMDLFRLKNAMEYAGLTNVQVGGMGGPRIWMEANQNRWYGKAYWRIAQAWNFFASFLPGALTWHGTYWARGDVPAV